MWHRWKMLPFHPDVIFRHLWDTIELNVQGKIFHPIYLILLHYVSSIKAQVCKYVKHTRGHAIMKPLSWHTRFLTPIEHGAREKSCSVSSFWKFLQVLMLPHQIGMGNRLCWSHKRPYFLFCFLNKKHESDSSDIFRILAYQHIRVLI